MARHAILGSAALDAQARHALPRRAKARAAPSLRRIVSLGAGFSALLGAAVAVALGITTQWQREALEDVARDSASLQIASEIEVRLLSFHRMSNAWVATGHPSLEEGRRAHERELRALLARAGGYVGTSDEADALARVEHEVESLLGIRAGLEASGRPLAELIPAMVEPIDRAEAAIARHRAINEAQVLAAHGAARRVDDVSTAAGGAAVAVLLGWLGLVWVAMRRVVLRPLDAVREALGADARLRRERAPESGPREIRELAHALNDRAAALEREHDDRLAFLAGVAHDLRNPLGAIKMALALARRDHPEDLRLGVAARQIDRLSRQVGDLLDATRIEAGQLELELAPCDVSAIAREVVELHRPTLEDAHAIELDAPEPALVHADAGRIDQVITNLVSNAVKYSPGGGTVRVSVSRRGEMAEIAVSDEGIGIAEHELADIFSPFRRRPSGRAVAPGAGLGLSVVRRIVEGHAGLIEVRSTPRIGTTFVVSLPLAARPG